MNYDTTEFDQPASDASIRRGMHAIWPIALWVVAVLGLAAYAIFQ